MGVTGAGGHVKERFNWLHRFGLIPTHSVWKLGMYRDLIYIYSFCVLERSVGVSSGRFLNMYGEAWDMSLKHVMYTDV